MSETPQDISPEAIEARWAHTLATTEEGPNPIPVDESPEAQAQYEENLADLRARAVRKAQREEGEA